MINNLFAVFLYLQGINFFETYKTITKLKIYGRKERNTAYKLIDNYLLLIKFKIYRYLKHLPFLFKLADLMYFSVSYLISKLFLK